MWHIRRDILGLWPMCQRFTYADNQHEEVGGGGVLESEDRAGEKRLERSVQEKKIDV